MNSNVAAATAFLNAMKAKDLAQAPVSESVSYSSPLSGVTIHGREHMLRFVSVYLPVINDVRVVRHIAEGDYVATVWNAETSFGLLSMVWVFRVEAEKIVEIQAFYDPRGFLERLGTWAGAQ